MDFLPVVGRVPELENVWVAGGYSGHGNVLGFACGELVARAVLGDEDATAPVLSTGATAEPGIESRSGRASGLASTDGLHSRPGYNPSRGRSSPSAFASAAARSRDPGSRALSSRRA